MEVSRSGDCSANCVFPSPVEAHRPEDNSATVKDGPESDDAAATDADVDHKAEVEHSLPKFVNEQQTSLSIHRPQEKGGMWVFLKDDFSFSPQEKDGMRDWACLSGLVYEAYLKRGCIQEKIKLALGRLNFGVPCVFAQFWAPVTVDGCFYLTTFNQPFAFNAMDNGLQEYRKHCLSYKFNLQRKCEEEDLIGPPSRVFWSQLPESTPCLSYYSIKEYPQRDYAIHCGLKYTYIFPVLEPSGPSNSCCVGVLEVVGGADYPQLDYVCNEVRRVLKDVDLTSFIVEDYLEKELAEGLPLEDVSRNGRHVVGSEQSNSSFSYKTISTSRTSDQEHTESKQSSESLAVSQSTLQSTGRKPDILNGSSYKRIKTNASLSNLRLVNEFGQGVGNRLLQSKEDSSCSNSTFKQATDAVTHTTPHVTAMQDAEMMTIKAYCREHIIKFLLPSNSGIADLEKEMTKRLKTLKDGSFSIKYKDCDGDLILIACDEDLQAYIASSRSVSKTSIMMWIQPKEDGLGQGHASVKWPQEGLASLLTPPMWAPSSLDFQLPLWEPLWT